MALQEIRSAAARNLASRPRRSSPALLGILPLSHRITRDLGTLTEGASGSRRATSTRACRCARATSSAGSRDLQPDGRGPAANQDRLLEQERLRKELEMGRRIQEEMLPHERAARAVRRGGGVSIPAREVGGDFFNYFLLPEGERRSSSATSRARASPPRS